jgi:glucan phosphorylase
VTGKVQAENLTKVLYPNDNIFEGKELRLRQEYFLVSCSLQDIIRRFKADQDDWDVFPQRAFLQLNDTHPSLAIPELMRILMDENGLGWDKAWELTTACTGYTNHTILPEAMEVWPVEMLGRLLPRHLQIIYEINARFLRAVATRYPSDTARLRRMSLIGEEQGKQVRMAHLAVVGSCSVNGVSAVHTRLLKERVLRDFAEFYPAKFNRIIPAADLSEQISLAGTEASGTGNMKLQLNGALTIGTLDGANIEIREEVGEENIFIFGLTADQVEQRRASYNPWDVYNNDEEIRRALKLIEANFFSMMEPGIFRPILDALLKWGDHYMLLTDLRDYIEAQARVDALYLDQPRWLEKAILNVARAGKFSSDRTIQEYAADIWHVEPCSVKDGLEGENA